MATITDINIALMTGWRPRWNPALNSYAKPVKR